MSESFNEKFCIYLEYYLGGVFQKSECEEIRHFWCDGVAMSSHDQLQQKYVNDKRKLITKAWIGIDGQSEYKMIIVLGKYSLRRYARKKNLNDCIPSDEATDWMSIDNENRIIELRLL